MKIWGLNELLYVSTYFFLYIPIKYHTYVTYQKNFIYIYNT